MLNRLPYKFLLPSIGAPGLPLLAKTILTALGAQLTPQALVLPFVVGGSFGIVIGHLLDRHLAHVRDIRALNEKLQLEVKERAKGEAWYAALFEKNHSIILLINPNNGAIADANPAACEFYGYSRETLRSMYIFQINTLSRKAIKYEMSSAKKEKRKHFNFKHQLSSGEVREVEVYSGAVDIDDEMYLLSVIRDITELKALRGIIPICSMCKQIRDDQGYWSQVESYVSKHSEADFSHSICPECAEILYPGVFEGDAEMPAPVRPKE